MKALTAIGLALLLTGCAGGPPGEAEGPTRDRYALTAEELRADPTIDAYEAVQRLRRFWLLERGGTTPKVFIGGDDLGSPTILRQWRADMVLEMKFIDGNEARVRFGPDYSAGVIEVTVRE